MSMASGRDFADKIGTLAVKALLYEVSATPKPGLVDRANDGAHRDMDFYTFLDSATALLPYFKEITAKGVAFEGPPEALLDSLRSLGRTAEKEMFAATAGVNTHKGLIFSLGILCASVGYLSRRSADDLTLGSLLDCCGRVAGSALGDFGTLTDQTHGAALYRSLGLTGIRGEAAAGFPNLREHGYPALRAMVEAGCTLNDAGVIALLHLMAHVEDTNLIARGGRAALGSLQAELRQLLSSGARPPALLEYAAQLDQRLTERHLSPGGCADLLALSYMLYFLFHD